MKKSKTQKGITLIALIITIVVLLILAVVAIRAVQGDGIIQYAKNARDDYEQAQANEQGMLDNYISQIEGSLDGGTGSSSQITWTKTSEGDLAVGSTVVTSTGENFYVIGFNGDNNETVILLAKNNLKADGSAQDTTGAINSCAFSTAGNFTTGENLNNNSTIKADTTSAVYKAMRYGETLGVTTGRLMTVEEVEAFGGSVDDSSASGCPDFINSTVYWLGSAESSDEVWGVGDNVWSLRGYIMDFDDVFGLRPVVEVLKSNIS